MFTKITLIKEDRPIFKKRKFGNSIFYKKKRTDFVKLVGIQANKF